MIVLEEDNEKVTAEPIKERLIADVLVKGPHAAIEELYKHSLHAYLKSPPIYGHVQDVERGRAQRHIAGRRAGAP